MAALMIQGCGSDVGKSVLVAGLCRAFTNRGLTVRPFKPQNMSNNAAVTQPDENGLIGEIGRAQALQAIACRTAPTVHMNSILLKPQSDTGAQLVVRGQVEGHWKASIYQQRKAALLEIVLDSFERLHSEADLVIVEGAGSPAEINLREGDIANMGFARAAHVPVVLVGDIDRGHVIAALVGAKAVLDPEDAAMIHGFIINKFRGDPSLFDLGREQIAELTGWHDLGMVPWLTEACRLPAEDAVVLQKTSEDPPQGKVRIAVPMLSRIANFDDFDPLAADPNLDLQFVPPGQTIPVDSDWIILPGTKATIADMTFLKAQGWDIDILSHVRRNKRVLGICGGYQLLGRHIHDPHGVEGEVRSCRGLGLLDVETTLHPTKTLKQVSGQVASCGSDFTGYEIHVGQTFGADTERPVALISGQPHGATSPHGLAQGLYIHGVFDSPKARAGLLGLTGAGQQAPDHATVVDAALDAIAATLEQHLDLEHLYQLASRK
ncbi:cobyric acid synthase [uncultured Brevundimonas sp.]|uniref:cobyric acid synthase n=1 Tax=uncultured Brevundimonas sp. TaxID=213418 RepID=UPI00262C80C8|nr:cobyric acid synthase [uncultured Brevundimonas sp.]